MRGTQDKIVARTAGLRTLTFTFVSAAVLSGAGTPKAWAQSGLPTPVSDARTFFWGNSAMSFIGQPGATANTNVGVPLRAIANAGGFTGCEEGSFTPNLIPSMLGPDAFPPPDELDFTMILGSGCGAESWDEANFTVGVLTDNNFSALDPSSGWGDVSGAIGRIQEAKAAEPGLTRWFLYSYQYDLDAGLYSYSDWYSTFQPQFIAAFHQLQDDINQRDPSVELRLIPIGTILLELIRPGGLLEDFEQATIFVDDAPHQSETTAVIMGAIAFCAIYRQPIPAAYSPPSYADARLRSRWRSVADFIWSRIASPALAPRVFGTSGQMGGGGDTDGGVSTGDMGNVQPDGGPTSNPDAETAGGGPDAGVRNDQGSTQPPARGGGNGDEGDEDSSSSCMCVENRGGPGDVGLSGIFLAAAALGLRRIRRLRETSVER